MQKCIFTTQNYQKIKKTVKNYLNPARFYMIVMNIFETKRSFRLEFKRQIRLAVTAAIGFSIAYSWKESMFATFQSFVTRVFDVPIGHYLTQVYTSIFITFLGVALIFLTSKLLRDR
jgi:hypothetical protein